MRGFSPILLAVAALLTVSRTAPAHDWNDAAIKWQTFDEGVALAQKEKKPICLVVFTEWCPHCKNYAAAVFHEAKVVEQAKQFVMIHVDKDQNAAVSAKYQPDGGYIPRTMFLKPDGTLDPDIKAPRDKYLYFYDEKDPAPLLAAMETAQKKLKP